MRLMPRLGAIFVICSLVVLVATGVAQLLKPRSLSAVGFLRLEPTAAPPQVASSDPGGLPPLAAVPMAQPQMIPARPLLDIQPFANLLSTAVSVSSSAGLGTILRQPASVPAPTRIGPLAVTATRTPAPGLGPGNTPGPATAGPAPRSDSPPDRNDPEARSSPRSRTPTPTRTPPPTRTPTKTPAPTSTRVPVPTNTPRPTVTPTPAPTNTPRPIVTPTPAPTNTPRPTATPTDEPTATPTDEPTATPTDEPTATPTDEPTATPTDEPFAPTAELSP